MLPRCRSADSASTHPWTCGGQFCHLKDFQAERHLLGLSCGHETLTFRAGNELMQKIWLSQHLRTPSLGQAHLGRKGVPLPLNPPGWPPGPQLTDAPIPFFTSPTSNPQTNDRIFKMTSSLVSKGLRPHPSLQQPGHPASAPPSARGSSGPHAQTLRVEVDQ